MNDPQIVYRWRDARGKARVVITHYPILLPGESFGVSADDEAIGCYLHASTAIQVARHVVRTRFKRELREQEQASHGRAARRARRGRKRGTGIESPQSG